MISSKVIETNKKIEKKVTNTYQKIEDTVVGSYQKIEDAFVEKYLVHDGETTQQAKERVKQKGVYNNEEK